MAMEILDIFVTFFLTVLAAVLAFFIRRNIEFGAWKRGMDERAKSFVTRNELTASHSKLELEISEAVSDTPSKEDFNSLRASVDALRAEVGVLSAGVSRISGWLEGRMSKEHE